MTHRKFHIAVILLLLGATSPSFADSLPKLSADKAIKKGVLPNGMNWYFASNPSSKGVVSFSLVQKTDPGIPCDELTAFARNAFASSKCGSIPLEQLLSSNGLLPSDKGYITCRQGAIVYSLGDFATSLPEACLDSTILALFRLADATLDAAGPSSSLAVIAAGEINESSLLSKMKTLSIINPCIEGQIPEYKYQWDPSRAGSDVFVNDAHPFRVCVRWHDARVPKEYMSTVLPVMSEKMAGEFGWVIENRLYPAFRSAGLHVWIDYDYKSSAESLSDEVITLSVCCAYSLKDKVTAILRQELSRLYTWGVDETEYTYARDAFRYRWFEKSRDFLVSNDSFTERCSAEFLYGASLSTEDERMRFAYRDVPDSTQTRLFNNYIGHLLAQNAKKDNGLKQSPALLSRTVLCSFFDTYAPKLEEKAPKADKNEYVTGGVMWTFPGGVNVIYKKMATDGQMYYSYSSKGGRQWADADYFTSIDGVYGENFTNFLSSKGIKLELKLNPADVRLEGSVPDENFTTLLKVLAALSCQKENEKVFASSCYKLLVVVGDVEIADMKAVMSQYVSSLRPGGKWSAAAATEEESKQIDDFEEGYLISATFPLDLSASNRALADVAMLGLRREMGRIFAGGGLYYFLDGSFVGFPTNGYRLAYAVIPGQIDNFPSSEVAMSEIRIRQRMSSVLKGLAAKTVSAAELKVLKSLAKSAFEAYKATPKYYIEAACDRYLSNKDISSKYTTCVDAVTSTALKQFYASAAQKVR